jgi:hypothetical protein
LGGGENMAGYKGKILFLFKPYLNIRWSWVTSVTFRPFYSQGKKSVLIEKEDVCLSRPVWTFFNKN